MEVNYPMPDGLKAIPTHLLDLRSDAEIDAAIMDPAPVKDEKNIWLFWHSGYKSMYPYTQRNVRTWHRRFSRLGWVVRVLDTATGSSQHISKYLNMDDPTLFPKAFRAGNIKGDFGLQHTSDLVRWPLLITYGGVYVDCGFIQIGDLDTLWNQTLGNAESPYEVLSYMGDQPTEYALMNYFMCSRKNNPFFTRCNQLLIALWDEDGGKTSTDGMHASPLLRGVPLQGEGNAALAFTDGDRTYTAKEGAQLLTDYIIQGQVISLVMGLVDKEGGWDGPAYVRDHVYAVEFLVGAQLINEYTAWDGRRAFELMSLTLPAPGETETTDQAAAREIVEGCLTRSFGFKLATGLILKVLGPTLSSMWRENPGSDDIPGTYAHWFRHGTVHWLQTKLPPNVPFEVAQPLKVGPLLREA